MENLGKECVNFETGKEENTNRLTVIFFNMLKQKQLNLFSKQHFSVYSPAGPTTTSSLCGLHLASKRWLKVGIKACKTCVPEKKGSWLYLQLWPTGRKGKVLHYDFCMLLCRSSDSLRNALFVMSALLKCEYSSPAEAKCKSQGGRFASVLHQLHPNLIILHVVHVYYSLSPASNDFVSSTLNGSVQ